MSIHVRCVQHHLSAVLNSSVQHHRSSMALTWVYFPFTSTGLAGKSFEDCWDICENESEVLTSFRAMSNLLTMTRVWALDFVLNCVDKEFESAERSFQASKRPDRGPPNSWRSEPAKTCMDLLGHNIKDMPYHIFWLLLSGNRMPACFIVEGSIPQT